MPKEYGITRLVLMPVDLEWVHAYWEVAPYTWREVEKLFGPGAALTGRTVLRVYPEGPGLGGPFDVQVREPVRHWYFHLPARPGLLRAELGLVLPDGRFVLLAVSNKIWMPAGRVSEENAEKWVVTEAEWERIFESSGKGITGVGSMKILEESVRRWKAAGAVSSRSRWERGVVGISSRRRQPGSFRNAKSVR